MNIYDTAHKLAEEIKKSDECVQLAELRERAYADETNRLLLEEYKRLQVQLQMSMVGAAGEMPSEDMQRFQQLASLLYMNSDVQAYLMAEMQMQKTLFYPIYPLPQDLEKQQPLLALPAAARRLL